MATSPTIDVWEPLSSLYQDDDQAVSFTSVAGLTTRRDQGAPLRAELKDLSLRDVPRAQASSTACHEHILAPSSVSNAAAGLS